MVDWGANVGVSCEDVTVVNTSPQRHVNILGIDNHDITSVPIATFGAFDCSQSVPVIIIMHQYEYHRKGNTSCYSVQLYQYKNDVNEKLSKVNCGKQ